MLPSLPPHRDFRWFLTAQTVSLLGTAMAPVALAFAVLDASPGLGDLGVVLTAYMVPLLVFLLVGGATADRLPRRTVLVAANLGSAVTQGAVAALLLTGRYALWPVAALGFLNGVLAAFTTPALRGIVPELVPGDRIRQANSLLASARNATKILGPSLSGVLAASVGGGPAIAFDALTYLLAAGCLTRLSSLTAPTAARRPSHLLADIREGWAAYRRIRWVWTVSLCFCVVNLVQVGTWQILGPVLTRQLADEAAWGFVLSARGAGLLVMSTLMYRLAARHLLRLGVLAGVLGALPLLALGAHLGAPWLIAAAFTAGLGSSVAGVGWDTSLQEHVPSGTLSRVSSFDDLLSYIAIPVGQLSVGPLADRIGGFRVAAAAGVVYAAAALAPMASAAVRRLPHGRPAAAGTGDGAAAAPPEPIGR
ncbi:MFS transporter [Actinacidiphila glaucinigra]|uniref:MFS transporter n=1 Tax=Actinacidiphila glaucinigra TaxID=235986 RepID=UPI002DDB3633|nr:MFS transporter [Actinacidiphila glaucinigra]WSD64545.1 MFS transporter [Actinacidiphila glaucinigra]